MYLKNGLFWPNFPYFLEINRFIKNRLGEVNSIQVSFAMTPHMIIYVIRMGCKGWEEGDGDFSPTSPCISRLSVQVDTQRVLFFSCALSPYPHFTIKLLQLSSKYFTGDGIFFYHFSNDCSLFNRDKKRFIYLFILFSNTCLCFSARR